MHEALVDFKKLKTFQESNMIWVLIDINTFWYLLTDWQRRHFLTSYFSFNEREGMVCMSQQICIPNLSLGKLFRPCVQQLFSQSSRCCGEMPAVHGEWLLGQGGVKGQGVWYVIPLRSVGVQTPKSDATRADTTNFLVNSSRLLIKDAFAPITNLIKRFIRFRIR